MTENRHTPTPWETKKTGPVEWIVISGNIIIARCSLIDHLKWNKANAEFIVKTCNSYDALLEACRNMVIQFGGMADSSVTVEALTAVEMAKAAIAEAEKG